MTAPPRIGWFRTLVAWLGARFIYLLIWIFGRTHRRADVPWLLGPIGGPTIGDAPYRDVAAAEQLTFTRGGGGGLVPDWSVLGCSTFDTSRTQPLVREFYERTADFAMDVWSKTYFPSNVALALLVTTVSRQVNQLNFPLSPLDTALGISSEIIQMHRADGSVKYTGWFRTMGSEARVLYTGFYMTQVMPGGRPCVKVVFPMPNGNATVILRPELGPDGALTLDSSGRRFGDVGFYRVQARGAERLRVWHIRTLRERFRVYTDDRGVLRCDHSVHFFGIPVLRLHYKMWARS